MCNLYTMTATVDEMRRVFGPFTGDTANLPPFDEIYPGHQAPVLRREGAGLKLEMMTLGLPRPRRRQGPAGDQRPQSATARSGARPRQPGAALHRPRHALLRMDRRDRVASARCGSACTRQADPLFAFAGIWRPGDGRAVHGLPHLRAERDGRRRPSQGDAGDAPPQRRRPLARQRAGTGLRPCRSVRRRRHARDRLAAKGHKNGEDRKAESRAEEKEESAAEEPGARPGQGEEGQAERQWRRLSTACRSCSSIPWSPT